MKAAFCSGDLAIFPCEPRCTPGAAWLVLCFEAWLVPAFVASLALCFVAWLVLVPAFEAWCPPLASTG